MVDQELIQETNEMVEVVEATPSNGKKVLGAALVVGAIIGTVALVKKVIIPKVKARKEAKAAALAATQVVEEESK